MKDTILHQKPINYNNNLHLRYNDAMYSILGMEIECYGVVLAITINFNGDYRHGFMTHTTRFFSFRSGSKNIFFRPLIVTHRSMRSCYNLQLYIYKIKHLGGQHHHHQSKSIFSSFRFSLMICPIIL